MSGLQSKTYHGGNGQSLPWPGGDGAGLAQTLQEVLETGNTATIAAFWTDLVNFISTTVQASGIFTEDLVNLLTNTTEAGFVQLIDNNEGWLCRAEAGQIILSNAGNGSDISIVLDRGDGIPIISLTDGVNGNSSLFTFAGDGALLVDSLLRYNSTSYIPENDEDLVPLKTLNEQAPKVSIDETDNNPSYLNDKLEAGNNITFDILPEITGYAQGITNFPWVESDWGKIGTKVWDFTGSTADATDSGSGGSRWGLYRLMPDNLGVNVTLKGSVFHEFPNSSTSIGLRDGANLGDNPDINKIRFGLKIEPNGDIYIAKNNTNRTPAGNITSTTGKTIEYELIVSPAGQLTGFVTDGTNIVNLNESGFSYTATLTSQYLVQMNAFDSRIDFIDILLNGENLPVIEYKRIKINSVNGGGARDVFQSTTNIGNCEDTLSAANNVFHTLVIPEADLTIKEFGMYITSPAGVTDNITLGVYLDSDGALKDSVTFDANGIPAGVHREATSTGYMMEAGEPHWLSIKSDNGAVNFLGVNKTGTSILSLRAQFYSTPGLPPNISTSFLDNDLAFVSVYDVS